MIVLGYWAIIDARRTSAAQACGTLFQLENVCAMGKLSDGDNGKRVRIPYL